ncbi:MULTISPECIES: hypothetical protein [Paraburkholderia]|uniref:Uncharacterized protein n=1 Tax=Paraburkholderia guartelaensis TaxID=2546446 RepID=A0ABU9SN48_9BURK|nr:hypothetical protein [Paraburkholderia nodosa]
MLSTNGADRWDESKGSNRSQAKKAFARHANLTTTSVMLYGIIDSGLGEVNNQGGKSNVQATSGGLSGSRFGFRPHAQPALRRTAREHGSSRLFATTLVALSTQ